MIFSDSQRKIHCIKRHPDGSFRRITPNFGRTNGFVSLHRDGVMNGSRAPRVAYYNNSYKCDL